MMANRSQASSPVQGRVREACGAPYGSIARNDRVVIAMPHPPASLSPNGRAHWRVKAADANRVRTAAMLLTRNAIWEANDIGHPWSAARLDICWMFAGVQPDADNIVSRIKNAIDGIEDACLVLNDQSIQLGAVTFERVPRKDQAVVLTLTRIEVE